MRCLSKVALQVAQAHEPYSFVSSVPSDLDFTIGSQAGDGQGVHVAYLCRYCHRDPLLITRCERSCSNRPISCRCVFYVSEGHAQFKVMPRPVPFALTCQFL